VALLLGHLANMHGCEPQEVCIDADGSKSPEILIESSEFRSDSGGRFLNGFWYLPNYRKKL
jgi:hypothetical protein